MTAPREVTDLVAVDLSDALACLIIRRHPDNRAGVLIDYAKHPDLSNAHAAHILRHLADRYEEQAQ